MKSRIIMNKFKNYLLASVGFLVLVLTISLTGVGTSIAQTTGECVRICTDAPLRVVVENVARIVGDVKITNDSASPVPTKNIGPVQVASSSREPVYIKFSLLVTDVFQKEVEIALVPGDAQGSASFSVPAGKLLVIEGVSGFAVMGNPNQKPQVGFKTTANNNLAQHLLFCNPFGSVGYQIGTWGNITVYADPGSTVEILFQRSGFNGGQGTAGTANLNVTFSGHTVDQ